MKNLGYTEIKINHLRIINEINLGLVKSDEEMGLLSEAFLSTSDEGFQEAYDKYIKYPFLKQRFNSLSDREKATTINKIEIVVNGGNLDYPKYSGSRNEIEWIVMNALAAYAVIGASSSEKVNIVNLLTNYYSPYPEYSEVGKPSKGFSPAAYKVFPPNVRVNKWDRDLLMDFLSISFYNSIAYLLNRGAYNPSPDNVFEFILFQRTWRQRFINEMRDYFKRRGETMEDFGDEDRPSQIIKLKKPTPQFSDGEEEEELNSQQDDIGPEMGVSDTDYDKIAQASRSAQEKTNDEKIQYIGSKLSNQDKRYLNAWYKWYKMNTGDADQAKEKIVDTVSSGSELAMDVLAPKDESDETKKFYDFVTKEMELSPAKENNAARSGMSRMKERIIEFIKDPEFIKTMGISDFSKGKITRKGLLKGTQKMKGGDMSESEMMEFLNQASIFLKEDFEKNFMTINKVTSFHSMVNEVKINESYEVETKDLDQEIFGYLKFVTENLHETAQLLNDLYMVHESIRFEYPKVSEKIAEIIPPISNDVSELLDKIKEAKSNLKPVLYGLDESKKKFSDELEEERLTNPETKELVKNRENFIGSHIYGEDLGGLGKMYVTYSYGEQFPVYLWFKDKWYHNSDNYILDDGSVNEPTLQHKADMRPTQDTHGMSTIALDSMIRKFKRKHGLGDNVHKDVEPGEKN